MRAQQRIKEAYRMLEDAMADRDRARANWAMDHLKMLEELREGQLCRY